MRPSTILLIASVAVSILLSACSRGGTDAADGAEAPPGTPVEVVRVAATAYDWTYETSGSARAWRSADVAFEAPGVVRWVSAERGDHVRAGEPLLELDRREFALGVVAAEASLREAEMRLRKAEQPFRARELAVLAAELERAQAEVQQASQDLSRMSELHRADAASRDAREQRELAAARSRAALRVAEENLALAREGSRSEDLELARAAAQNARAALDRAQLLLSKCILRAPFDGVVAERSIELGERAEVGRPVLRLLQLDPIKAVLPIPERYINRVDAALPVEITADAIPDASFTGRITAIGAQAEPSSRCYPVEIMLPNPDGRLRDGMVVRARVIVETIPEALLAPVNCLVDRDGDEGVFLVREGRAVYVPLPSPRLHGHHVILAHPVRPGDALVIRGQTLLSDGEAVRVINADPAGHGEPR
ncbi:efflux RND transporter periplasmic adaptor subunit [bacterium]|nr:efflux RND transporter periplasmic adaptor subunit [bacterium]